MKNILAGKIGILLAVVAVMGVFACGGEPTMEENMYEALNAASEGKWQCYEAIEKEGYLTVRIEVDYIPNFKEGKEALAVVQKVAPNSKGMIDFTNAQTGMVVRKVPIEDML